jgi:hypothetical protein
LLRQDLAIWEGDLGALVVPTSHMINMQLHMARKKKEEKKHTISDVGCSTEPKSAEEITTKGALLSPIL